MATKKVTSENFNLISVSLSKEGRADIEYTHNVNTDGTDQTQKTLQYGVNVVHPDFKDALHKLKGIVADVFDWKQPMNVLDEMKKGFNKAEMKKLQEIVDKVMTETLDSIVPYKISIKGTKQSEGVVITSRKASVKNDKTALNTPHLKFESTKYGFEDELREIIATIKEEAFEYLFKNKKGQLELFNPEDGDDGSED